MQRRDHGIQQPSHLVAADQNGLEFGIRHVTQLGHQGDLGFQFGARATSDVEERQEFAGRVPGSALSDV